MISDGHRFRIRSLFFLSVLVWLALFARLIVIQIIERPALADAARKNHLRRECIAARRGAIVDRDLNPLARTLCACSVLVVPADVQRMEETLLVLSSSLSLDPELLRRKAKRGRPFYAARGLLLDRDCTGELDALDGVYLEPEHARVYPQDQLAAHVVGFTGVDNCGLEGAELEFDSVLSGAPGWAMIARDARGQSHALPGEFMRPPEDGRGVVLTIDGDCQAVVEDELRRGIEDCSARGGTIIVMDPRSGDVVAMAGYPSFDPNQAGASSKSVMRNRAVTDIFEPGSTFKVVTLAAAVRHEVVDPNTVLDAEEGSAKFEGYSIRDHHPYGEITFREAVEHSSNICFAKVALRMAPDQIYRMARAFGLGCLTGIALPGEVVGMLRPPREWSRRSLATIAIGQEVAVTAIQLASVFSAVANHGLLMVPRIALGVKDSDGNWVERFPATPLRRVLSEEEAHQVTDYLIGVVEQGTGAKARLEGLSVAGKTGTAQKAGAGGYVDGKYVASFGGYLPAHDPVIAILVVIDEPEGKFYGGEVAAPVFRRVVERMVTTRGVGLGEELAGRALDSMPASEHQVVAQAAGEDSGD